MYAERIEILQVANGFMVTLPFLPKRNTDLDMFHEQALVMKKVLQEDEIISRLQEQERYEQKQLRLADLKTENIHIFKTFTEVLAFLKYTMDEK